MEKEYNFNNIAGTISTHIYNKSSSKLVYDLISIYNKKI